MVPPASDIRRIFDFKIEHVAALVAPQHIQRAIDEKVELKGFQITSITGYPVVVRELHAVAHSSQNPNSLYTVKAGIWQSDAGWHFVPLGDFRGSQIAHCSCLAGQKLEQCKHLARLLQYCVPDLVDHFGEILPDVPAEVHEEARRLELKGIIHQSSSHQRKYMIRSAMVDVSINLSLAPLLQYNYISPHHAWHIKRFSWECPEVDKYVLTACPTAMLSDSD